MTTPACYTIDQTAAQIGCSRAQVYNFLRDGRLSAVKLGAKTLVTASELTRFIASLPSYQAPGARFGRAA